MSKKKELKAQQPYKTFENQINKLEKFNHSNELVYKALNGLFGATSDGMLIEIMDSYIDFSIQLITNYWCDKSEWIKWYIYENKFGKSGLTASVGKGKKMKKIDSVKKLWNLIEETREQ